MKRVLCLCFMLMLSFVKAQEFNGSDSQSEVKQLVSSIAPLYSLLQSMTEGLPVENHLLIAPERSPHNHQFRPSDLQKLTQADYLLWVGPDLESMLPGVLHRLPSDAVQRSFMAMAQLNLLPTRDHHSHGHDHDHHHGEYDAHLWLDISNLQLLAAQIYQDLLQINPAWQPTLAVNFQRTQQELHQLDAHLLASLASIGDAPFIVFHDAYQYFEKRYGLQSIAAVLDPGRVGTSLQRQFQLRALIREHQALCVFVEPQFEQSRVRAMVGDSAQIKELDPLGVGLPLDSQLHLLVLRQIADQLQLCMLGE